MRISDWSSDVCSSDLLATAPKSNAAYKAFGAAQRVARDSGSLAPPAHILNAPTRLMKDLGYGKGYAYDHDTAAGRSEARRVGKECVRPCRYGWSPYH